MDAIDTTLLSDKELAEFRALSVARVSGYSAWKIVGQFALWTGIISVLILVERYFRDGYSTIADLTVLAIVVACGLGLLFVYAEGAHRSTSIKKVRDGNIALFLLRINYKRRVHPVERAQPRSDDDGFDHRYTWATGTYDPARYYSYSKSTRDYMKATGMDADTYDSNMPS